jgi:hypothetical protein
MIPKYCNFATH